MRVLKAPRTAETRGPFTGPRENCRRLSFWKLCLVIAWCGVAPVSAQTVLYVDQHATGPVHDGSSWCSGYLFLQDALAEAEASGGGVTEIRVADGIYKPDQGGGQIPGDREATFQLLNGLELRGGFAGCGAADPDERDITAYETILSGDLSGDDDVVTIECTSDEECELEYGESYCDIFKTGRCWVDFKSDNSRHVVTGREIGPSTLLDGLTIRAGHSGTRSSLGYQGAGVYIVAGSPAITNCTFDGNMAAWRGGGMYVEAGSPTVTRCTFRGNRAVSDGGGVCSVDSALVLTDCMFKSNRSNDGGGLCSIGGSVTLTRCSFTENWAHDGGGTYVEDATGSLVSCTFTRNFASWHGGGLANYWEAGLLLTECTFTENEAERWGGGMFNNYGNPTLVRCSFIENVAGAGGGMSTSGTTTLSDCAFVRNVAASGGGMHNTGPAPSGSVPTLTRCVFLGNQATRGETRYTLGGALSNHGDVTLINCLLDGNTSHRGGAIGNYGADPVLLNCTLTNNIGELGGAIFNAQVSNPRVGNSILSRNTGVQIYNWDDVGVNNPIVRWSCIQGGWPGAGNIDADPVFIDPDGPDDIPGTEDDDLRLAAGSPCIDAGHNVLVPASVTTDLDGKPRFVDDPVTPDTGNPGTIGPPVVDMGAYEYQPVQLDILPGQCPNRVNTRSHRVLPVAIVGTPGFDVTQVDLESLTLRRMDGTGGDVLPQASRHGVRFTIRDAAASFAGDLCECHTDRKDGLDDLNNSPQ